jgi:hypothetical protein
MGKDERGASPIKPASIIQSANAMEPDQAVASSVVRVLRQPQDADQAVAELAQCGVVTTTRARCWS